ncbi:MAG: hydrogenase expression/formation protein HypE [Gammaproteobacteria bacterium]|jgi:hydrogenase expression/formation protein HypE
MSSIEDEGDRCPLPFAQYPEIVLAHGGGGALTQQLLDQILLPAFANPILDAQHDGAVLEFAGARLAFTTDSFVVRPWSFPGGDIGDLAVNGTVNDLLMCGADPRYLSAALILEEGFAIGDLQRVVGSMSKAAQDAGVTFVTGDTKVVDRGHGDGIYINTAGIGVIADKVSISPAAVAPGDVVILSGDVARHGIAVMAAREGLDFETEVLSDTAALCGPVGALLAAGVDVHCLRDPTRGGLATSLIEIAGAAGVSIRIDEAAVPVAADVRGACELLGLDPLYVANEGRFIAFVPAANANRAVAVLATEPLARDARVIGHVTAGAAGEVVAKTVIGGERSLDRMSGEQLPRIC